MIRVAAGVLLFAIITIAALPSRVGRVMLTTALMPWRLARTWFKPRAAVAVTLISLTAVAFITATLTGFTAPAIGAASAVLLGVIAIVFEGAATWPLRNRGRGRLLVSTFGSMLPATSILLAAIAYLGPLGFWYGFWMLPVFRVALLTLGFAAAMWTAFVLLSVRAGDGWHGRLAGTLSAAGAAVTVWAILLPDWAVVLRALDRPLNLAPATDTMVFALRAYAGVNLDSDGWISLAGATLLLAGAIISLTPRRSAARRPPATPV